MWGKTSIFTCSLLLLEKRQVDHPLDWHGLAHPTLLVEEVLERRQILGARFGFGIDVERDGPLDELRLHLRVLGDHGGDLVVPQPALGVVADTLRVGFEEVARDSGAFLDELPGVHDYGYLKRADARHRLGEKRPLADL